MAGGGVRGREVMGGRLAGRGAHGAGAGSRVPAAHPAVPQPGPRD